MNQTRHAGSSPGIEPRPRRPNRVWLAVGGGALGAWLVFLLLVVLQVV